MLTTQTVRTAVVATTVGILCVGTASAGPAFAGDDEEIRRGHCSGSSDWKLKVKTDDGRLEVEGEVDSNVNGQRWRWRIRHEGHRAARGRATTTAPSGSFDVERRVANAAGSDRVGWRARNPRTGETCRGGLTF